MGDSSEIQVVQGSDSGGADSFPPMEPVYFMLGFIAGLIFISLFKGRWFL